MRALLLIATVSLCVGSMGAQQAGDNSGADGPIVGSPEPYPGYQPAPNPTAALVEGVISAALTSATQSTDTLDSLGLALNRLLRSSSFRAVADLVGELLSQVLGSNSALDRLLADLAESERAMLQGELRALINVVGGALDGGSALPVPVPVPVAGGNQSAGSVAHLVPELVELLVRSLQLSEFDNAKRAPTDQIADYQNGGSGATTSSQQLQSVVRELYNRFL